MPDVTTGHCRPSQHAESCGKCPPSRCFSWARHAQRGAAAMRREGRASFSCSKMSGSSPRRTALRLAIGDALRTFQNDRPCAKFRQKEFPASGAAVTCSSLHSQITVGSMRQYSCRQMCPKRVGPCPQLSQLSTRQCCTHTHLKAPRRVRAELETRPEEGIGLLQTQERQS